MQDTIELDRVNKKCLMKGMILLGAFLFCYMKAISELLSFWARSYVYSYGFLIPAISTYLVWTSRKKLNDIEFSPSYISGLLLFSIGLLTFILGNRSSVFVIESLSLIFAVCGVVLLIFGKKSFFILLFPIAYLLFMIPVWDFLTVRLQFPFQKFTAFTAAQLLNLSGVPVYRNSIFLELPNITLEVATICSGINNLIAVLAIALPLAHLFLKSWPKRILLVTGAIAIATLSNGLRVAIMGFLSYKGITATLHGPGHIFQAMFVSFVGFIVLFIGVGILSDRESETTSSPETKKGFWERRETTQINKRTVYFTACILLIVGVYVNFFGPSPVLLKSDLKLFPYKIGSYQGKDATIDNKISEIFDTDNAVARVYTGDYGSEINLYIGYREFQEQGKELVNYKSAEFHNGASLKKISADGSGTVEINKVISQGEQNGRLIYFWYDLNGHIIADRYYVKIYTAVDSIFSRRTNGAIVIVSADIPDPGDSREVIRNAEDFIRMLIPILHSYLPDTTRL